MTYPSNVKQENIDRTMDPDKDDDIEHDNHQEENHLLKEKGTAEITVLQSVDHLILPADLRFDDYSDDDDECKQMDIRWIVNHSLSSYIKEVLKESKSTMLTEFFNLCSHHIAFDRTLLY